MKIKQYISSVALLAAMSVSFIACDSKEEPEYTGANGTTGERVYFQKSTIEVNISEDEPNFTFSIYRPEELSAKEYTVKLVVTDDSGRFSVPATATFAAGQPSATVSVQSDLAKISPNTPYTFEVSIDEADANEYALTKAAVVVNLPAWSEWAPFIVGEETEIRNGQGAYTFSLYYSGTENPVQVLARTNPLNPDEKEFQFQWLINNEDPSMGWETFMTASTPDNGKTIIVPKQDFAMNSNYGMVSVQDTYSYSGNETYKGMSNFNPETGLFTLNLIYYVSAGSFGNGDETLQLFGYADLNDYTLTLTDKGQIKVGDKDYAVIGFSYDSNAIASIDYTVVKVEDGAELTEEQIAEIAGILADPEQTTYMPESIDKPGNVTLDFPSSGNYTIVAVAYNADGEVKSSASVSFTYETVNPYLGWTEVGTAKFNSSLAVALAADYGVEFPIEEYEVTVSVNDENPSLYRINNPFSAYSYTTAFGDPAPFGSIEFVVEDEDHVYFPISDTDLTMDGDIFHVLSYSFYLRAQGQEVPANLWGTFKNGELSLPANGNANLLYAIGDDGYYSMDAALNLQMNSEAAAAPAKKASRASLSAMQRNAISAPIYGPYFFTAKQQAKDVRHLNINRLSRRF